VMRKLVTAALLISMSPAPAFAIDPEVVKTCWNLAPNDFSIGARTEIRIELQANGVVKAIDVLRYEPDTEDGRRVALSAARAVTACGPYDGESGEFLITFTPDNSASSSIITMPDNAGGTDDSLANEIQKIIDGQ